MINTLRNHLAIIAIAMAGSAFGASNADELHISEHRDRSFR